MSARHTVEVKTDKAVRRDLPRWLWIVYGATVLGFFAASFMPQSRLWGLAALGYLPLWVRLLLTVLMLAPLVLCRRQAPSEGRESGETPVSSGQTYLLAVVVSAVIAGVIFYLLRARTYFLGDGYTALSVLAEENPIIKARELGESLVHVWVAKLLGGFNEANALLSYQLVAVAAGALMVLAVGIASRYLFSRLQQRVLFAVGVLSGGFMLLYFGYVENYSLFILSVVCFLLAGLLALSGRLPKWIAAAAFVLTVFFHVFGVFLLPAAVYVMLAGTRVERRLERMSTAGIVGLLVLAVAIGAAALWAVAQKSFFVRIALLTPTPTRFTISGYTLFSPAHIADYLNLLVLLFPGMLVFAATLLWKPARAAFRLSPVRFLAVASLTALIGLFLFDPKLGMPRDWDLFSVLGVPVLLLALVMMLDERSPLRRTALMVSALIVVDLVVLAGRVAILASPERGVQQIANYIALDPVKGKNAIRYLTTYYERLGNEAEQFKWEDKWKQYDDQRLVVEADSLAIKGQFAETLPILGEAIRLNPMSWPAYQYLGMAYLRLRQCRQAVEALEIARGLNPHSIEAATGLGYAYFCVGDKKKAEASFATAVSLAPDRADPYFQFSQFYKQQRNAEKFVEYLNRALQKSDATGAMYAEMGNYLVSVGQYQKAATAYQRGLQLGLDTSVVAAQGRAHPELQQYFRQ